MSNFSLPIQWNANPDEVLGDFTPIPDGWYPGSIVEMEYKEKKDKPGEGYLQLTLELDEGEYKGRQFFDNLNLWDTGEKIQQFVQRKVNTLCIATGQHQLTDLNQLMHKRLMIKVKLQEGREVLDENTGQMKKYEARNQIQNYKAVEAVAKQGQTGGVPPTFGQGGNGSAPAPAAAVSPQAQTQVQAQVPQQAPAPAQTQQPSAPPQAAAPAPTAAPAAASGSVPPWLAK